IKIHIAAHMEYALAMRQSHRMVYPRAAVQERNSPHPVRMIVEDQEVKRPIQSPEQCECRMMKVSGTVKRATSFCRVARQPLRQRLFKRAKTAEGAGQTNAWAPVFHWNDRRLQTRHELSLERYTAVQV